jgi:hypothetical protein
MLRSFMAFSQVMPRFDPKNFLFGRANAAGIRTMNRIRRPRRPARRPALVPSADSPESPPAARSPTQRLGPEVVLTCDSRDRSSASTPFSAIGRYPTFNECAVRQAAIEVGRSFSRDRPLFAWLWLRLGRRQPHTPVKFALGLVGIGRSFAVMAAAALDARRRPGV